MKEQIDYELENITFQFDMGKAKKSKHKRLRYNILTIVIVLILFGSTAQAGFNLYDRWLKINGKTLPELASMKIVEVHPMSEDYRVDDTYEKEYDSFEGLQKDLGVRLLCSDRIEEDATVRITRTTDNENWTKIKIVSSPIDLSIDMILSPEQLRIGWDKEYLGPYEFVESYQTKAGYKANILKSGYANERPMYQAVFVADGIRYTIRGNVDIEIMKGILNNFQYSP